LKIFIGRFAGRRDRGELFDGRRSLAASDIGDRNAAV
jgi:hypothetical protein